MHHEFVVNHYACALFHKAISVRNAATIWDVASLRIEPLGGVVSRVQSDSDAYNTRTVGYFRFCAVKQTTCETLSAVGCEHIEVLNFGNLQVSKSTIRRLPVYRDVPAELPINESDDARPASYRLLV